MVTVEISKLKGIVVAKKANYYVVKIDLTHVESSLDNALNTDQNLRFLCTLRRRMMHNGMLVNVGDYVVIDSLDWHGSRAVIVELEPRISLLERPPVANITEIFVVLSVKNPDFYAEQASRFLLTAERSKVNVVLLLTKIDLISNDELMSLIDRVKGWGYEPLAVSAKTGKGIKQVIGQFQNSNLSVLCGPSGVGKSSLINLMIPSETIATGKLSRKLQRGRNTTRHVQLYSLKKQGALVADTPGFNMPNLEVDSLDLQFLFPELRSQLDVSNNCKFRDCLHCEEPGCRIEKSWERYPLYRKFLEENINSRRLFRED